MANNEHGDFQTPRDLTKVLLDKIPYKQWDEILEPTCGIGNFLWAASNKMPNVHRVGLELQSSYISEASKHGSIVEGNIFSLDLKKDLPLKKPNGSILVVGNPPWVTNSALSTMGSINKPVRANNRGLRGIEAITGSSNFDVAEFIWIKLLVEFSAQKSTVALLCKTQVARNVLLRSEELGLPILNASMYIIDAKKWFDVNVDACWFVVEMGKGLPRYTCDVFDSLDAETSSKSIGVTSGQLISNVAAYKASKVIDGVSPLVWRQGIKHDATAVMELLDNGGPRTRSGDILSVEDGYIFPMFKSTDVFHNRVDRLSKWMIVPQQHTSENTDIIRHIAPKLWNYLEQNAPLFDKRKSSIYRNKPRFSIFGVGDYSFSPYKVVISGFHKEARFQLVGPINGKPAVFDDTCYLLSFENPVHAGLVHAMLNLPEVSSLLDSLVSWDSKRPITKKILQRIDLLSIAQHTNKKRLLAAAQESIYKLNSQITLSSLNKELSYLVEKWNGQSSQTTLFNRV